MQETPAQKQDVGQRERAVQRFVAVTKEAPQETVEEQARLRLRVREQQVARKTQQPIQIEQLLRTGRLAEPVAGDPEEHRAQRHTAGQRREEQQVARQTVQLDGHVQQSAAQAQEAPIQVEIAGRFEQNVDDGWA